MRRFVRILLALLIAGPPVHAQSDSPRRQDRFEIATEPQLDSLYAPLVYLMREDEQGTYASLSLAEKRDFLRRFWARRHPKGGARNNEAEERFNARIGTVNRQFSEHGTTTQGTTAVPGWRTDRGRVYLEHGPPHIILSRRGPGVTLPFSVWKYMRGNAKPRKYCFVDITGFGNSVLVYSNDPREPSRSDWRQLLGEDGYAEALEF